VLVPVAQQNWLLHVLGLVSSPTVTSGHPGEGKFSPTTPTMQGLTLWITSETIAATHGLILFTL
jgi:hypothetical protein